jgi:hypothetical protein
MRIAAALLLFSLLSLALAQQVDPATGCEKFSDHVVCPKTTPVLADVRLASDVECVSIASPSGPLESLGCQGSGTLTRELRFEECKVYIPFSTDVEISGINDRFDCRDRVWSAGSPVTILMFEDTAEGCAQQEGDEFYSLKKCAMSGVEYSINATASSDAGVNYLFAFGAARAAAFDQQLALIVVGVALVAIVAYYATRPRKRR